jgi:hypothetical protein
MEASESKNPDLLPYIRGSYGLAGIVYEVTFKLKAARDHQLQLRRA